MRGFQCLLLCVLLYSASVDAFGDCDDADDDGSCPDNATCEDEDADNTFECECEDGFDEIDVPGLTIGGEAVTVCVGMENINLLLIYLHSMYISPYVCIGNLRRSIFYIYI